MSTVSVKISDLSEAALDWAVLVALHGRHEADNPRHVAHFKELRDRHPLIQDAHFSTNWSHGGPIIEREGISVQKTRWVNMGGSTTSWVGYKSESDLYREGPTPLVAAMRCYVASKAGGDSVMIPEELI